MVALMGSRMRERERARASTTSPPGKHADLSPLPSLPSPILFFAGPTPRYRVPISLKGNYIVCPRRTPRHHRTVKYLTCPVCIHSLLVSHPYIGYQRPSNPGMDAANFLDTFALRMIERVRERD